MCNILIYQEAFVWKQVDVLPVYVFSYWILMKSVPQFVSPYIIKDGFGKSGHILYGAQFWWGKIMMNWKLEKFDE